MTRHISEPLAEIVDEINKAQEAPVTQRLTDDDIRCALDWRATCAPWATVGKWLGVDESTIRRAVERYRAKEGAK